MAEIVRARDGVQQWEHRPWYERRSHSDCFISIDLAMVTSSPWSTVLMDISYGTRSRSSLVLGKLPLVVCAGDVVSDHLHSLVPCLLVVFHIWCTLSFSFLLFRSETRTRSCKVSESAIKLAERRAGSRIHLTDEKR